MQSSVLTADVMNREKWTFPAKPNIPHTMSIDFGLSTGQSSADSTVVMAGSLQ